ncbi:MAG TPA: SDR family oxidoreductase [Candidatus Bathyarchaeia archaeon]|nr:SDR family oxidoreductase [Candidatus Bathyarchaeia archaeon]
MNDSRTETNRPSLSGKVAIVTGAGRGIGRAISIGFAKDGAKLAILSRTKSELDESARQAKECGADVFKMAADVSDEVQVKLFVKKTLTAYKRIDILVNNAGVLGPIGPMADADAGQWWHAVQVNLMGTFLFSKHVLPTMIKQRSGKIVNLSGAGSPMPYPMFSSYSASKVAVLGLTQTLAEEVKAFNIQVNAIAPGAVDTRLQDEILSVGKKAGVKALAQAEKTKRLGGVPAEKAAELARFLASDESNGVTGRFLSAVWDDWKDLGRKEKLGQLMSDVYTLRRIDNVLYGALGMNQRK